MLDDLWSHIDWRLTLQWALVCVPWDVMDTIMYRGRNSIISFLPERMQDWAVRRIDFDHSAPVLVRLWDAATAMFRTGWHAFKAVFMLGVIVMIATTWQQAVLMWFGYAIVHGLLYGGLFRLRRRT